MSEEDNKSTGVVVKGYLPCPKCGEKQTERMEIPWWVIPRWIYYNDFIRCQKCGYEYHGRDGKPVKGILTTHKILTIAWGLLLPAALLLLLVSWLSGWLVFKP
jgi:predicted nucleic-acid-binding Zn-ribbon protein